VNSVVNYHSFPECCPENAHQFFFTGSCNLNLHSEIVTIVLFSLAPQLLEMFLFKNNPCTHTRTKQGRHHCEQFCCTTKYCVPACCVHIPYFFKAIDSGKYLYFITRSHIACFSFAHILFLYLLNSQYSHFLKTSVIEILHQLHVFSETVLRQFEVLQLVNLKEQFYPSAIHNSVLGTWYSVVYYIKGLFFYKLTNKNTLSVESPQ
jgi:hypothetical protein